jgi:hypothetical protein
MKTEFERDDNEIMDMLNHTRHTTHLSFLCVLHALFG